MPALTEQLSTRPPAAVPERYQLAGGRTIESNVPRLANQGLEVGETENAAGVTAAKEFSSGPGLEKPDGHKSNTSYAKGTGGRRHHRSHSRHRKPDEG
jgi:hypothetical protein